MNLETVAPFEVISYDGSVAACEILLETKKADILDGELLEDLQQEDIATLERLLEVGAQDAEVFFSLILMSCLRRHTELWQVRIGDFFLRQRLGERSLGEPSLAACCTVPNVNDRRDSFAHQQSEEFRKCAPFVAESEDAGPSAPQYPALATFLWVHTRQRGGPKAFPSSIA